VIDIVGYQIKDKIYESSRTEVYRGVRQSDNRQAIFKTLKKKYPTTAEVTRLKHEYDLLCKLDYPGAIEVFGLETYSNSPAIVMEDFGGESLTNFLKSQQFVMYELLNLAIHITHALRQIHEQNIIHKDINPTNIIWNPKTGRLQIIDFGIATKLSRENLAIKNPNQLEGTLPYISPEQTGRMNRVLDYRTDYYSLGVTFYQMFTGKLPFESTDPLELVHCHIAKMPIPLNKLDHKIPPVLANIVMKLMAKIPEERYQGSYGLRKDLERCLDSLKKGKSEDFEIGKEDIPEKFHIPEKLYGREEEIASLIDVFNGAANGIKDMMFVFGSPGIGKSALINEIHKPIVEKRGYFCSGKYDQYRRNIPYSALIQAFRELLKQFLSESEEKLAILKKEIFEAVGGSGQVIIGVIPEVEIITGKQPDLEELPPTETQNRFNMVFQNFIRVFAKKEHPLVLFLDDLQWADNASLELIRVLLEDIELNYFLFIGAYRDNEVDASHPLSLMQEKMKESGYSWKDIHVGPLMESHIGQLVADTLHCDIEETKDLAKLLLTKTGGNPFFLKEYLKTLYERGLIEFKPALKEGGAGWTSDIPQIRQAGITENIIELLAEKVKKLSANTWEVLKIACCIGEKSSFNILAAIYEKSTEDTFEDLRQAIEEGIVIFIEDSLRFVHDRVMEASYSLINELERKKLHYIIGKKLLGEAEEDIPEDSIFSIADQWNQAKELLDEGEQRQLLEINFRAGQKAKASAAYAPAVNFFRQGAELLSGNPWENDYQYTLSYYTEWSEAEYQARNVEEAEQLFDTVLQKAAGLMDMVKIYFLQLDYYFTQGQYGPALKVGLKALDKLGVPLPKKPGKLTVIRESIKTKILSRKREIEDWLHHQEMQDDKIKAALDIMIVCTSLAIIGNPALVPILTLKMVNLSLKHGNSPPSSFAYGAYGLALGGVVGDYVNGYRFCKLGAELGEKYNIDLFKSKAYMGIACSGHLTLPPKESLEYQKKWEEAAKSAGDFSYLVYVYDRMGVTKLYSGENLNSIKTNFFQKYEKAIKKLKNPTASLHISLLHQTVLNLLGESGDFLLLKGDIANEEETIHRFLETNDGGGFLKYYCYKQFLSYLTGNYSETIIISQKGDEFSRQNVLPGGIEHVFFAFFYALTLSALIQDTAIKKRKKKYLRKLRSIQKKYKKWGKHNKIANSHRYLLLSAEVNRITGKDIQETARLYNDSISLAHKNGNICDEGIACELTAQYYLSLGQEKIAALYINEAHYCYMRWGCRPKVKQLEEEYPDWITGKKKYTGRGIEDITITTSTTGSLEALDLGTIIKASNTIAREIKLDQLLKKMMGIVIENAGAQRGYFLLPREGEWLVEAEGLIDQEEVKILQSIPITNIGDNISENIVKYVERTQEIVVLNDAVHKGIFTEDEYIKKQKPKSVLCLPLLNQGKLAGILYMENNLTTGAFTSDQLDVLNTLSSQIVISIENAKIYKDLDELNKNLEQKVTERTMELEDKNEQILDSIRYSQKIQNAMLPLDEQLKTIFPEHFILFLPRDIVSGDFYWLTETDNNIFLAVVDCTGHGVPGALLAMMGDIFLNEIIITNRIFESAKILEELHKKVRSHLKQAEETTDTMDGMDVCLCRIVKDTGKLQFAGAKRPLYILNGDKTNQDESEEIQRFTRIRGDNKFIGGRQKEVTRTYTNHEIEVPKGSMIYLTTDGFVDQPDANMKKYGSKRFMTLLIKVAQLSMPEQKQYLEDELKTHKGSEKQRDDITIIGIRF
jgi:predicted ATPase/serine phosphatase RsbU (regulator of sigma subunit)